MSIQYEPGEGHHICVRIEERCSRTEAVRRVEFEDSDDEHGDGIVDTGWGIRWALDMLNGGSDQSTVSDLANAIADCESWEPIEYEATDPFAKEQELLLAVYNAAHAWREYRRERLDAKKKARAVNP